MKCTGRGDEVLVGNSGPCSLETPVSPPTPSHVSEQSEAAWVLAAPSPKKLGEKEPGLEWLISFCLYHITIS